MKRALRALVVHITVCATILTGCGNANTSETTSDSPTETEPATEQVIDEEDAGPEQDTQTEDIETVQDETEDVEEELDALGKVDVDQRLFDVTVTIPQEYIGEMTQEDLDASAREKGSMTLSRKPKRANAFAP